MQYSIQSDPVPKKKSTPEKVNESKQQPLIETSEEEEDMSPTAYLRKRNKNWPLRTTELSPARKGEDKQREISPFRSNQLAQDIVGDYKGYRKITSDQWGT